MKIIDYIGSPQYNNFFKEFDKKLTKNLLKRCIVDPFAERIMKKVQQPSDGETAVELAEIQFFENDEETIK